MLKKGYICTTGVGVASDRIEKESNERFETSLQVFRHLVANHIIEFILFQG